MYVTPETMRECLTKLSETGLIRPLPEAPKKLEALTQAWREGIIPNATDANMKAAVSYLMQEEETGGSYVTVARFNKALRVVRQRAASARSQIIKDLEESDTGVLAELTMNDTADEALEESNQYAGLLYRRAAHMAAAGGASKRGIERAGTIAVQRFNEGGALKSLYEHFQDLSEAISGGTFLSPVEAAAVFSTDSEPSSVAAYSPDRIQQLIHGRTQTPSTANSGARKAQDSPEAKERIRQANRQIVESIKRRGIEAREAKREAERAQQEEERRHANEALAQLEELIAAGQIEL